MTLERKRRGVPRGIFGILRNALSLPGGLRRLCRNAWLDLRYGGRLLGGDIYSERNEEGIFHTMNTDYNVIEFLFGRLELRPEDIITDLGCGKGRVFNLLLHKGIANPMVGIEISPSVAAFARGRLAAYPQISILEANFEDLPKIPGSVFYLYNPFGEALIRSFSRKLAEQWRGGREGRPVVIYNNPLCLSAFLEGGVLEGGGAD